jgi:hypothetical protein
MDPRGSGPPTRSSDAEGVPWMQQASRQLQDYYYDSAESLKPFQVTLTGPPRKTIDRATSSKKIYQRFSTTNMQYGDWYLD